MREVFSLVFFKTHFKESSMLPKCTMQDVDILRSTFFSTVSKKASFNSDTHINDTIPLYSRTHAFKQSNSQRLHIHIWAERNDTDRKWWCWVRLLRAPGAFWSENHSEGSKVHLGPIRVCGFRLSPGRSEAQSHKTSHDHPTQVAFRERDCGREGRRGAERQAALLVSHILQQLFQYLLFMFWGSKAKNITGKSAEWTAWPLCPAEKVAINKNL